MTARLRARLHSQDGDVLQSWLLQLVLLMAIVGLLGYEFLSVAMTGITLDGDVEQIADAAADGYDRTGDLDEALAKAEAEAEIRGAEVVEIDVDGDFVEVTATKRASTLIAHRFGFFDNLTMPAATARSRWRG